MLVSLSLTKELLSCGGGGGGKGGRYIIEDFIHKGSLCMEAAGFKGFPFQVIQHICRPNII